MNRHSILAIAVLAASMIPFAAEAQKPMPSFYDLKTTTSSENLPISPSTQAR